MKIVVAILLFCVIIIVHELGHFLLAKMNGIAVRGFSIGFGPSLLSYTKNGTKYALNLIPFGGACIFDDEDPENISESSFLNASVWARIAVIAAGPVFNFILAFIMSLFLVGSLGYDPAVLVEIQKGSPAEAAGLEAGDVILKMNHENIKLYREITMYSFLNQNKPVELTYERDGQKYQTTLTQQYDEETKRYYYGFLGNTSGRYTDGTPLDVIKYSVYEVRFWIKSTIKSLGMLIQGQVSKDNVMGPIGITQMVGDVYEDAAPAGISAIVLSMMDIAILISANLGVMNLLPIPALDGGRLMFLIIEAIRRKPIDREKEGMVHFVGFALLMVLMVFILYNDIMRLFQR